MDNPFGSPKEYNPFEDVVLEAMPVARPVYFAAHPPVVLVAEPQRREGREGRDRERDTRWLELPGAFCVAYFCGPCYTFVHLCCAVVR